MVKQAVILGNGISRKTVDLDKLRKENLGSIYGCNAIIRDFTPDYLIAIDDILIDEIIKSSFPKDRFYVPQGDELYEPAHYNPNRPKNNAGMVAMNLAIGHGANRLLCFGMDFLIADYSYNLHNVYSGSAGYEMTTSYVDCMKRVEYFNWFAKKNTFVEFIILFPKEIEEFRPLEATNVIGKRFWPEILKSD